MGRNGLVGQHLTAFGVQIPFTTVAVILAETFVALPFYVIAVEGSMRGWTSPRVRRADLGGERPALPANRGAAPRPARHRERGGAGLGTGAGEPGAAPTLPAVSPVAPRRRPWPCMPPLEQDPQIAISMSIALLAVSILVLGTLRAGGSDEWGSMLGSG